MLSGLKLALQVATANWPLTASALFHGGNALECALPYRARRRAMRRRKLLRLLVHPDKCTLPQAKLAFQRIDLVLGIAN